MFREPTDDFIEGSLAKMSKTDKEQVAAFIEMQAAYKRARAMKGSVRKNSLKLSEVAGIVRNLRKTHAGKKK